tara:strand:- start:1712 stop:2446 length:735 start_codon:yes stop_codon:yes gene_type:complete
MKWFKHETDAMDSEKMKALIHEFGYEGYGWFWRIMEIVAKKMDETNRCHYEQPVSEWCVNLKVKRKKLGLFLELIQLQTNIKAVYSGDKLRIEIPNLLKKRDNYTKNLQVASNENARKFPLEVEVEVDVEVDKKPIKGKVVENPFDFEKVWILYPLKDGKKQARRFFDGSVKNEQDWKDIHTALKNYLAHVDSVRKNGHPDRAYKNGSTWFNNWRDWVDFEAMEPVREETWAEARQKRKAEGVV